MSKQSISNGQITQHMAKHDELGHLVGLDNPSPVQQSSLPTDVTDCRVKLKQLLSAPNIEGDQAEGEDQDVFDEDTEEESEEPDEYEAESDDSIPLGLTVEGRVLMQVKQITYEIIALYTYQSPTVRERIDAGLRTTPKKSLDCKR